MQTRVTIPKADPTQDADGPERQCVVTRERRPAEALIRFVKGPDGVVVPDLSGKLPGRGVWVAAERAVLEDAVRRNAFARGLKCQVQVPDGLVDQVAEGLLRRCQNLLGLAKRAGQVVLGFDQVRAALRAGPPGWLIEAADGAADGREKVYFLARALYNEVRIAGAMTSAELGMAFGRERVVHTLLLPGPMAEAWTAAYGRLTGFRPEPGYLWFTASER